MVGEPPFSLHLLQSPARALGKTTTTAAEKATRRFLKGTRHWKSPGAGSERHGSSLSTKSNSTSKRFPPETSAVPSTAVWAPTRANGVKASHVITQLDHESVSKGPKGSNVVTSLALKVASQPECPGWAGPPPLSHSSSLEAGSRTTDCIFFFFLFFFF